MFKLVVLSALPLLASCFLFGRDQSNWDGLKVTWGINPFSSFQSLPRTKAAAQADGWVNYVPGETCGSNPLFKGERFIKNKDMGAILIFDPAGYIAGMQIGFPQNYSPNVNNYPFRPLTGTPVILDKGIYYVTAYFVNPATLCNGRTADHFKKDGTGTGLWIQNGTDPVRNSVKAPMTQTEVDQTMWTKGVCFPSMGLHYWYDISLNMNCDNLFPVFLLYNGGVLNAFGWALAMELGPTVSNRIEHPPLSSYSHFMDPVPKCLGNLGTMTTLHIYLTDSATSDTC